MKAGNLPAGFRGWWRWRAEKRSEGRECLRVEAASVNAADYRSMRMKKRFHAPPFESPDKQKDLES
jgi:hypothetical protein